MPHPRTVVTFLVATTLMLLPLTQVSAQSKELTLTATPSAIVHFREGWAAVEGLDAERARHHLMIALEQDPNFGLARAMYVWQGGASAATAGSELTRAVSDAAKGSTEELLLAMAFREAAMNRRVAAATLLSAAANLLPADPFIAMSASQFGAGSDAQSNFQTGRDFVAKHPEYGPGYNRLAYAAWAAGDHVAALEAAMKQVQLTPKNANSHDTYAEMMQWSGKLPEALMHYQEAVTLEPGFTEGYVGMAEVESLQGHYDKARADVEQAIAHTTQSGQKLLYMRDIVGIDALAGDRKAMQAQLMSVANEAKTQGDARIAAIAYSQLAASYAKAGDAKSAHSYIDMAHATYPTGSAPASFFTAMAHGQLKHWDPARAAIAEAKTASDAAGFAGRIAAAEAYLAVSQGRAGDAIALLASADLTDPVVASGLAEAYTAAGRPADAAKLNQQIINGYALNLVDFPAADARYRARMIKGMPTKK